MRVAVVPLAVMTLLVAIGVAQAPAASQTVVATATGSGPMVRPDGTVRSCAVRARQ